MGVQHQHQLPGPDFPPPGDTQPGTLGKWTEWDDEHYGRSFTACTQAVGLVEGTATVRVTGWQSDTGEIERLVTIDGLHRMELTAKQALALSAALAAAAAHIGSA